MPEIVIRRHAARRADRRRDYHVLIDGARVGEISAGDQRGFEVAAGTHELQLKIDWVSSPALTLTLRGHDRVTVDCEPALADEKPSFMAGLRAWKAMTIGRKQWIVLRQVDSLEAGRTKSYGRHNL